MNILEVIPLANFPANVPQLLSYFFDQPLPKGSIVEILIGRRKTSAIVVSSSSIEDEKLSLKKSTFQVKRISKILSDKPEVSEMQFQLALCLARSYYAPLGICFKTVLPPFFLKKKYERIDFLAPGEPRKFSKPLYITCPAKKTIDSLSQTILDARKSKGQVLIIAPDMTVMEHYAGQMKEAVLIHSSLSNSQLYSNWEKIANVSPLIIGTRAALFAPYHNLKLIIVEDAYHEAYKSDMTPRYRTTDMAIELARLYGADIIFTSPIMDISTYYNAKENKVTDKDLTPRFNTSVDLIDQSSEIKTGNFSVFSRSLQREMENNLNANKSVLLFSSRKGYSGILLCENCGLIAKCPNCSIPLRVHKIPETALICHHCLKKVEFPKICSNCSSYKLKNVGLPGSQKIAEGVMSKFPDTPIHILDATLVKDQSEEEKKIIESINAKPAITVASSMVFSHRYSLKYDLVGIVNGDGLMNLPEYRSEERMIYQLAKLLDFRPEKIIIQSFNPANQAMRSFADGSWRDFYVSELIVRKAFSYPPFSKIVKLSLSGPHASKISTEARILAEKFKMVINSFHMTKTVQMIGPSPAFIAKEKGRYTYNIVLKINPEEKIDKVLKYIPAGWSIDVDPNEIL